MRSVAPDESEPLVSESIAGSLLASDARLGLSGDRGAAPRDAGSCPVESVAVASESESAGLAARARALSFDLLILALLVSLPFLRFWRLFTANRADAMTIVTGDFTDLHFPYRSWAVEWLGQGVIPTWNPFVSAGHPSLGDIQFGLQYPLTWLTAMLARGDLSVLHLQAHVVAHLSIASAGLYLFLRALGRQHIGALLGALIFTYAGYLMTFPIQQIIILETFAWFPWILLSIELTLRRRSVVAAILCAGSVALASLVGHPQTLATTLLFASAFGLHRAFALRTLLGSLLALGGAAVGLGLAAPALLPALSHLAETTRTGVGFEFTTVGHEAHELLGLIVWTDRVGFPLYVGLSALLLAAIGYSHRPSGGAFWAGTAGFGLILSMGGNTFLYSGLYVLIPGLQYFRNHERVSILVVLAVAVLASAGIDRIARGARSDLRVDRRIVLAGGAIAALFAVATLGVDFGIAMSEGLARSHFTWLSDRFGLVAIFGGFTVAMLGGTRRAHASARLIAIGLLLVVSLDLFTTPGSTNLRQGVPGDGVAPTATVRMLREQLRPGERIASEGLLPGNGNAGALFRLPDVVGNTPLELGRYRHFDQIVPEVDRWRLLNVRFVLTRRALDHPALRRVSQEGEVIAYETSAQLRLPSPRLVHRVLAVADDDAALAAIPTLDLRNEVAVTDSLPPLDGGTVDELSRVQVVLRQDERLVIDSSSPRDAVLVLAERDYPGWTATLDEIPVPIHRVNGLLRGVYVPAGERRVDLRFVPPGLAEGQRVREFAISILVVALGLRLVLGLLRTVARGIGGILRTRVRARERAESPGAGPERHAE